MFLFHDFENNKYTYGFYNHYCLVCEWDIGNTIKNTYLRSFQTSWPVLSVVDWFSPVTARLQRNFQVAFSPRIRTCIESVHYHRQRLWRKKVCKTGQRNRISYFENVSFVSIIRRANLTQKPTLINYESDKNWENGELKSIYVWETILMKVGPRSLKRNYSRCLHNVGVD